MLVTLKNIISFFLVFCFVSVAFAGLKTVQHRILIEPIKIDQPKDIKSDLNPFYAGLWSMVWNGGGHLYQGDFSKGLAYSVNNVALIGLKFYDVDNAEDASIRQSAAIVSYNFMHGYQMYDAYTDAIEKTGYRPMLNVEKNSALELLKSTYDFEHYKKPAVWGPLLAPLSVLVYSLENISDEVTLERSLYQIPAILLAAALIGAGEEAASRGFHQPLFTEMTQSYFWGNTLQATYFGLCHTRWRICEAPFGLGHVATEVRMHNSDQEQIEFIDRFKNSEDIKKFLFTGLAGYYFGWINRKYGIRTAVALHFAWDALLFAADYMETGESVPIYLNYQANF